MSGPLNAGLTTGGTITIGGLDFASSALTPTASVAAEQVCGSTAWTSATTVACAPPAYDGSPVRTAVTVSAAIGTLPGQFSFDGSPAAGDCELATSFLLLVSLGMFAGAAPVVSMASANVVQSGGGTVTITGLSFGTDGRTPTASLNAANPCSSSAWTSATTVACTPRAYHGTAVQWTVVSVTAVVGTLMRQFSFDGTCKHAAAVDGRRNGNTLVHGLTS